LKDTLEWMMKRSDFMKESSMLNWFPKICDLDIPMPETFVVKIPYQKLSGILDGEQLPDRYVTLIEQASQMLGYPLFLRTDNSSQKHDWKNTCYVENSDQLQGHISMLIDSNGACDLVDNAIILREYIQMYSLFSAFWGDFPVSREMRNFIRDGKIQCKHWYWFEEVMKKQGRPVDSTWKQKLKYLNTLTDESKRTLDHYLHLVAERFPEGYWSVDFCQGVDGKWYLIDMARGEVSFHYPTCEKASEFAQEHEKS